MITTNSNGSLLAAGDDNGDIRIIDTSTGRTNKLISGHTNICTTVQFIKNKSYEVN